MSKKYDERRFHFIAKDGGEYEIFCWTTDTRSGFCHTAEIWDGLDCLGRAKVSYLNRTWERFTYESVILRCIEKFFPNKSQEEDGNFLREQVNKIAEKGAAEAEKWFQSMKTAYDGLHENTKQHLANALKDCGPLDKEQIEQSMQISQIFDVLPNM